ncbi:Glucose--fructose oxidoreductase precursor [Planctomycetes bacterium Pan216]|uniref:Glucose--fructose oxidoreductase n=1 Tax=Kolteria novifilia TaxID=2527975 RepID=A0A518AXV2_9BACT|nr:Glucose--fructose oxidoreductase precursor [Planctomycetes bacterium Pan216]
MELSKDQGTKGSGGKSLSVTRRDFVKAAAVVPAAGAFYFGYHALQGSPVKAGIVGTGNEGCEAMIKQSPPEFLEYVAFHDIRPTQIARARRKFNELYGPQQGEAVTFHESWESMLADPNIEAIVIATPLWTHAQFAIEAMKAGKHVMCEKLMAHNITDAKAMVRASEKYNKILSVGHQRHYSTLYDDAMETIRSGKLGDIRHIRAFWHRNNAQINPDGTIRDSWRPEIPEADQSVDASKYGYKDISELVRWRLYDRTGGGLMAELGSHQVDACSLFLAALAGADGHHEHVRPLAVNGMGGKWFYEDDRDCDDHIHCLFEFPNGQTVAFTSINTNAMAGYGEEVLGTRGSMTVMQERELAVFDENDPLKKKREAKKTEMTVDAAKPGEATMYSAASLGLPVEAAQKSTAKVSRGYKEELEHFAFCIRHPDPANQVRCDGLVALHDAVIALSANQAIRSGKRLEFQDAWFDPSSPETPDPKPNDMSLASGV